MPLRPCLVCGALGPQSRCPQHALRNGSTRQWRTRRAQTIAASRRPDGALRCQECGQPLPPGPGLHVDHRIPLAAGGTDNPANLTILCASCNLAKGAR